MLRAQGILARHRRLVAQQSCAISALPAQQRAEREDARSLNPCSVHCNALTLSGPLPLRGAVCRRATAPLARSHSSASTDGQDNGASNGENDVSVPSTTQAGAIGTIGDWLRGVLYKENIVAPDGYNRFLNVPFSFAVQLSIGSVYAWSMWNGPLTRSLGVVAPAADDWALGEVIPIFSACAVSLGLTTFFLGPWAERAGPRASGTAAAFAYATGLALTATAVENHMLPLAYIGYGVFGGIGWGLGYISPVSTLLKWFPDRRGLAAGLALTAFGGGAMLAAPLMQQLLNYWFVAPTYVGASADVPLVVEAGRQFVEMSDGVLREVVVATAGDVASLNNVAEGVYLVGTGNTGAAGAMMSLGVGYLGAMLLGAFGQRVPREGWLPEGWSPPDEKQDKESGAADGGNWGSNTLVLDRKYAVDAVQVLKTPQFYLLWSAVVGNAMAGLAIITSAKTLMSDVFSSALPMIVTGAFASSYVAALSFSNSAGRLGWAAFSDILGRKNTYYVFGLAAPICLLIPTVTASVSADSGSLPLVLFAAGTCTVITFYGGLFSVLPAYLADVFGEKHVGAIHGRMLTAWSTAAVLGPKVLTTLRQNSYESACAQLAGQCDPGSFQSTFGAGPEQLQQLIDANTVTIARLMEIVPAGTVDPTPTIYDSTLYTMSGVVALAVLCNAAMRPVDLKHCESPDGGSGGAIIDVQQRETKAG